MIQVVDIYPPLNKKEHYPDVVLATGFFDGVHRAHQQVIRRAKEIAQQRHLPLAVMTLTPHPAVVYHGVPANEYLYLSPRNLKIELMKKFGVDLLYIVHFTPEFARLTPQAFVDQYLVGLHAQVVVAGFDYTFGDPALANMDTLPQLAHDRFTVVTVPCVKDDYDHHKIGSSQIRQLITTGKIDLANQRFGYCYQTSGIVVHGDARGRQLGFPTANIVSDAQQLLPGVGIYAVELFFDNQWHHAMASVGHDVTFGNHPLSVEVYVFDYNGDLYDRHVKIRWYHYLRDEIKFANVDDLITQLHHDETDVRHYFKTIAKEY